MHRFVLPLAAVSTIALASPTPTAPKTEPTTPMALTVSPAAARPPVSGPATIFTGKVLVTTLFAATSSTRAAAAAVAFTPGARSFWHSHPAGQTLVVTDGTGWVQQEGGQKQLLNKGDVVWTPPGVKHWHGGTTTTAMTHIAIQEHVDGKVVDWLGPVDDATYNR